MRRHAAFRLTRTDSITGETFGRGPSCELITCIHRRPLQRGGRRRYRKSDGVSSVVLRMRSCVCLCTYMWRWRVFVHLHVVIGLICALAAMTIGASPTMSRVPPSPGMGIVSSPVFASLTSPLSARTHALTHARTLTHSRTHALAHTRTHARTHSRTQSRTHSLIHSPPYSPTSVAPSFRFCMIPSLSLSLSPLLFV
jgi:hypothetical protein